MKDHKEPVQIDLVVFEKNGKFEFAQIIKKNKFKATKALNGFLIGLKNEASGSKETSRIIVKFVAAQAITKEEEKHLKELKYGLNKAQELANIGHWELNLVTNTLFWSDEVYRIFGLQPQEFGATYEAFLEHIHPDDIELVNSSYNNSIIKKQGYHVCHRIIRKNGDIGFVEERCEHEFDDDGNISLNGDLKRFVTHAELNTALQTFITALNLHVHATAAPGPPVPPTIPMSLDISASQTTSIKTGG